MAYHHHFTFTTLGFSTWLSPFATGSAAQPSRPPPRQRKRNNPGARLNLQQLEARDNPSSAPAGLTDFSSLLGASFAPFGYSETHSIVRSEANTVTVDQAGTGSSGTFTVTVDASNQSSDTASGSATGSSAITATGTDSIQSTSHQVISGTYANGAFTITSETYTETGSYSSAVNLTTTYSYGSSSSTNESDSTHSGTYSLSFTATAGSYGMLNYTSYDYTASDTVHSYTGYSGSGGGIYETTTDAARTVHTIGSGSTATYTGTESSSSTTHMRYPNNGGTPYDYTSSYSSSNPISGTTYLMPLYESTAGWEWKAGTSNATNFTFHGVATQNGTLTESLTSRPSVFGSSVDVNSFSTTSHTADAGHVVDDEPGTPASGTELFHRDETFSAINDATGAGSYIGGVADATYHAVDVGTFAVANVLTVNNDFSSGTAYNGSQYSLNFNYSSYTNGSGIITDTHDYHDSGLGLEVTGSSIGMTAASTVGSRAWGTRNGQSFDDPSLSVESVNRSTTFPGSAGVVRVADGLENAYPFRPMATPGLMFIQTPLLPPVPNGILGKGPQFWYNQKVQEIGKAGEKKVTNLDVKQGVLWAINDTPFGIFPSGSGTFTYNEGQTFALGMGRGKDMNKAAGLHEDSFNQQKYKGMKLVSTTVEITYVVDQASNQNGRSGNVVARYKVMSHYAGTNKAGLPITVDRESIVGDVLIHDEKLEKMTFKE